MSHYRYAEALKHLDSTYGYLSAIENPFTRKCVAESAQLRITSAKAGGAYMSGHSGDYSGAKDAADKAWRTFPIMHNCP